MGSVVKRVIDEVVRFFVYQVIPVTNRSAPAIDLSPSMYEFIMSVCHLRKLIK